MHACMHVKLSIVNNVRCGALVGSGELWGGLGGSGGLWGALGGSERPKSLHGHGGGIGVNHWIHRDTCMHASMHASMLTLTLSGVSMSGLCH